MTRKWYATLRHPKMYPHTKFGIATSKNIGDMDRTPKRDGGTDGRTDSAITICLPKFLWGHKKHVFWMLKRTVLFLKADSIFLSVCILVGVCALKNCICFRGIAFKNSCALPANFVITDPCDMKIFKVLSYLSEHKKQLQ